MHHSDANQLLACILLLFAPRASHTGILEGALGDLGYWLREYLLHLATRLGLELRRMNAVTLEPSFVFETSLLLLRAKLTLM
jgi:hypothetical protein